MSDDSERWVSDNFYEHYDSTISIADVEKQIVIANLAMTCGKWKNLQIEVHDGYEGSKLIVIAGLRKETQREKQMHVKWEMNNDKREREQYERLKKKYEK